MKRSYLSIALALLLSLGLPAASAPPLQDDKPTYLGADSPGVLKGLKDIGVRIEPFPQEFLTPALTMDSVRTDIELKLKQNGFHVLPIEEAQKAHLPVLYINLNGFKAIDGLFVYNINILLQEDVTPVRTKKVVVVGAAVWQRGFVGATGELNLPAIRTDIKQDVDTFVTSYVAAQSKL